MQVTNYIQRGSGATVTFDDNSVVELLYNNNLGFVGDLSGAQSTAIKAYLRAKAGSSSLISQLDPRYDFATIDPDGSGPGGSSVPETGTPGTVLGYDGSGDLGEIAPTGVSYGAATTASDDATGAGGSSADVARADHKHAAQSPSSAVGNIITVGADGLHTVVAADATTSSDDGTGDGGSATTVARSDHKHAAQVASADAFNATVVGTDGLHLTPIAQPADVASSTANKVLDATSVIDEDSMVSDTDQKIPTQQSVKAYVDTAIASVPTAIRVPVSFDAGGGATAALPTGESAGKSYIITNADPNGTALGGANPITVHNGDKIVVADGVTSSLNDGSDFVKYDNTDDVSSVTYGGDAPQVGAVVIPDEVIVSATPLAGAAPSGAQFGIDNVLEVMYYVTGGNWAAFPVPSGDNITNADLTADGNHTQTWAGFDQIQSYTTGEFDLQWVDGTSTANLTMGRGSTNISSANTGYNGSYAVNMSDTGVVSIIASRDQTEDRTAKLFVDGQNGGSTFGVYAGFNADDGTETFMQVKDNGGTAALFLGDATVVASTATNGQVLQLVDATTGRVEFANAGADTSIATSDLTADAAHTHAFADFGQTWNNLGAWVINQEVAAFPGFYNGTTWNTGSFAVNISGGTFDVGISNGAGNTATVSASPLAGFEVAAKVGPDEAKVAFSTTTQDLTLSYTDTSGGSTQSIVMAGNDISINFGATSDLKIDGDAGTSGQVLQSQGPDLPPVWGSAASSNFANTDLTADADRTHDMGGFVQSWTNYGEVEFETGDGTPIETRLRLQDDNAGLRVRSNADNPGDETNAEVDITVGGASLKVRDNLLGDNASVGVGVGTAATVVGRPQVFIESHAVNAGTADIGQVLMLKDDATGESEFSSLGANLFPYATGEDVVVGDLRIFTLFGARVTLRCTVDHTTATVDYNNWEIVSQDKPGTFVATSDIGENMLLRGADGIVYQCINQHTTGASEDFGNALNWKIWTGSSPVIEVLSSAPASPLLPGTYILDSTGGVFSVELENVAGEWMFTSPNLSLDTNPVTITSTGDSFTDAAGVQQTGDFLLDKAGVNTTILNPDGGTDFYVSVDRTLAASSPFISGGNWDATTNTPDLTVALNQESADGSLYIYNISVSGTQDIGSGADNFEAGGTVTWFAAGAYRYDRPDSLPEITEQTIASVPATLVVDAAAGHLVNGTMDTANVTIDPISNLTSGTMVMRLIASGAARDIDLNAALKRPASLVLPVTVPDGQAAIVSVAALGGVQSVNITVEAA